VGASVIGLSCGVNANLGDGESVRVGLEVLPLVRLSGGPGPPDVNTPIKYHYRRPICITGSRPEGVRGRVHACSVRAFDLLPNNQCPLPWSGNTLHSASRSKVGTGQDIGTRERGKAHAFRIRFRICEEACPSRSQKDDGEHARPGSP
jgi:hypothetical protein